MSQLFSWLSHETAFSLCLALLHSLWQGAAIAVLLLLQLRIIPRSRSQLRYFLSVGSLLGLLLSLFITWSILRLPNFTRSEANSAVPVETHSASETRAISIRSTAHIAQSAAIDHDAVETPAPAASFASPFQRSVAIRWTLSWTERLSPFLLFAWGLGVIVHLIRDLWNRISVAQWKVGEPITDPNILKIFQTLRDRMKIQRQVQLIAAWRAPMICVVGIVKPMILIPIGLLAGMTPDQWEAVLAHELAHVRRWDDLVNFFQLMIESLLFFNPAVSWIGRQIRQEREVCCDAWGARVTQSPIGYARVLVDLSEQMLSRHVRFAPAFADEEASGLGDRIRRLVIPERNPSERFTWIASLLLIVATLCGLFILQRGTDLAVFRTAQFLTDEERVAALSHAADEVVPYQAGTDEMVTINGTVTTADGTSLPDIITITSIVRAMNSSSIASQNPIQSAKSNRFDLKLGPGAIWLLFGAKDFATTTAGPFHNKGKTAWEDVSVTLQRGVSVPVKVMDESGRPVPKANVSWTVMISGGGVGGGSVTTDEQGVATISHLDLKNSHKLYVTASGFQKSEITLPQNDLTNPIPLQLTHARLATGIVLATDGKLIRGAEFKRLRIRSESYTDNTGLHKPPLAVTDAEGKFSLSELLDGWTYDLAVLHPDFGAAILRNVQPGKSGMTVELPPALKVTGVVHGTAEQMQKIQKQGGQWRFAPGPQLTERLDELAVRGSFKLTVKGEEAQFEIPGLAVGKLSLDIDGTRTEYDIAPDSTVLDVTLKKAVPPVTRGVRIVFLHRGQQVFPEGLLSLSVRNNYITRALQSGIIELPLPVPNELHVTNDQLIGFAVEGSQPPMKLDVGTGTAIVEVPVIPAGAVKGIVRQQDGAPASDVSISVTAIVKTGFPGNIEEQTTARSVNTNSAGEFFLTPFPFGATCHLRATQGKYIQLGPEFTLSARNALPEFGIQLGASVPATVRVIDPTGRPLSAVPIRLSCRHPQIKLTWGETTLTNSRGEVTISAINPDLAFDMFALADCNAGFVPASKSLRADGKVTEIQLKPGLVIEGTLLDAGGAPMAGQLVKAVPAKNPTRNGRWMEFYPETPTDEQGRFRLSNLPGEPMQLRPQQFSYSGAGQKEYLPAAPGQVKPVVLQSR